MRLWALFIGLFFGISAYAGSVPAFYGTLKTVDVQNAHIAYYRFGQGKPLVMVTGHGDNMLMWHPDFLQQISQHREVIMFDYPGIGQSTIKGAYPNTMAKMSSIVQAFIDSQKLTKPDILGFSMGGSLVLFMATEYSHQYDHVIVIGAKAGGKKTVVPEKKYFDMLSDPTIPPDVAAKTLLFPPSAAAQADAYLKVVASMPPEQMNKAALQAQAEAVNGENNGPGIWNQLVKINNKTLVISGTDDVLSPVQNAVMIASGINGAWLARINGAGHGVLFQQPQFIANLVELFLNY